MPRITRTVAQCAAELGVSPDTVIRWIERGHLAAFVPPGRSVVDPRRGPKGYLIFTADWAAFLRARTMTGGDSPPPPATPSPSRSSTAAGTDGVSRRKQR